MPIDPNDLYNDFIALVNTFQGGFYPPASVFIRVANDISLDMWNRKTEQAENSNQIDDNLYPFQKTKNCIVVNTNQTYGIFNYPDDYGAYSAARIAVYQGKTVGYDDCDICGSKPEYDEEEKYQMIQRYLDNIVEHDVKKIGSSKWGSCLSSLTKPPTLEFPKITQTNKGYKVAPRQVSVVILDYYVEPTPATFMFTLAPGNPQTGSGDQMIYNKAASTPFQWNLNVVNEFLWELGVRFSVYTKDNFLAQISNKKADDTK